MGSPIPTTPQKEIKIDSHVKNKKAPQIAGFFINIFSYTAKLSPHPQVRLALGLLK